MKQITEFYRATLHTVKQAVESALPDFFTQAAQESKGKAPQKAESAATEAVQAETTEEAAATETEAVMETAEAPVAETAQSSVSAEIQEKLQSVVAEVAKISGDRLERLIEVLTLYKHKLEKIRQVRVFQAEGAPSNAQKVGEFAYMVDWMPSTSDKGDDRRGRKPGGRKGPQRGGRGHEERGPRPVAQTGTGYEPPKINDRFSLDEVKADRKKNLAGANRPGGKGKPGGQRGKPGAPRSSHNRQSRDGVRAQPQVTHSPALTKAPTAAPDTVA